MGGGAGANRAERVILSILIIVNFCYPKRSGLFLTMSAAATRARSLLLTMRFDPMAFDEYGQFGDGPGPSPNPQNVCFIIEEEEDQVPTAAPKKGKDARTKAKLQGKRARAKA